MALANVACLLPKHLANPTQRILMMDWDLEAPGLHRFFPAQLQQAHNKYRPGVIDYFRKLQDRLQVNPSLYEELQSADGWKFLDKALPLEDYIIPDVLLGGVDFIKAGTLDAHYPDRVTAFPWHEFYRKYERAIDALKSLLSRKYAYILIDSRTGFTDVSGICTMLLPEKLVVVFTPNRQSLSGVLDLASRATDFRLESNDFRPLSIFPLPSRIENAELTLKQTWRQQYQSDFEVGFCEIYGLDKCDLTQYFDEVQLPYVSHYAYGEKVAVLEERSEALSLRRAYESFFERLANLDFAWDTSTKDSASGSAEIRPAVEPAEKKYDAFLSYAHSDSDAVEQLATILQTYDIKLFLDKWSLVPGESLVVGIERAIKASAAVVLFVGPKGPVASQQSVLEWQLAAASAKRIIPVLLPGASRDSIPAFLSSLVFVDFSSGLADQEALRQLVSGIVGRQISDLQLSGSDFDFGRPSVGNINAHVSAVLNGLVRGRIITVLGPDINLSHQPLGKVWEPGRSMPSSRELSDYLAKHYDFPKGQSEQPPDITRVAEFVSVMQGKSTLYHDLHMLLSGPYPTTDIHQFFARLPRMMRERGYTSRGQIIVTMNYDDLLENAFKEQGELFHVVRYAPFGEDRTRGKFVHVSPTGAELIIERPNLYRGMSDDHLTVILKARGAVGKSWDDGRFVITEDDYIDYLSQADILKLIPIDLASRMLQSNYLFLGHRIDSWYLRAVVHLVTGARNRFFNDKAWAVQPQLNELERAFWAQRRVEVLNVGLRDYIQALQKRLEELPTGGPNDA